MMIDEFEKYKWKTSMKNCSSYVQMKNFNQNNFLLDVAGAPNEDIVQNHLK